MGRYLLFIYYIFIFKILNYFFGCPIFLSNLTSQKTILWLVKKLLVKLDMFKLTCLV